MNEIEVIQNKIYEIRGQRVILDFDLAELYNVETRVLNQAVKRNIERFPEDFMFQLTNAELEILRAQIKKTKSSINKEDTNWTSQFVTSNSIKNDNERLYKLENRVDKLYQYIERVLVDQNDINEDTRMQLDAITIALSELQAKPKEKKPRRRIGSIKDEI